ncbi:MAG TPA: hypothetical protein VLG46_15910, partial [Anaerolineae bacterium]|nr:hypothetical protein [Anaerolineae bacterium]
MVALVIQYVDGLWYLPTTRSSGYYCIDGHCSFYFNLVDSHASDTDTYHLAIFHTHAATTALCTTATNDHRYADTNADHHADFS